MAQGLVTFSSSSIGQRVDETKSAYLNMRRSFDRLIAIRNGNGTNNDYAAVALAVGAADAAAGQRVFDNMDAAMGGLTTSYNALSNMDAHANI
jgi:tRNA C32,U32 (ribose-2'-O)-methylase TrmJ